MLRLRLPGHSRQAEACPTLCLCPLWDRLQPVAHRCLFQRSEAKDRARCRISSQALIVERRSFARNGQRIRRSFAVVAAQDDTKCRAIITAARWKINELR